jgi:hypothetical protein
MLAVESKQYWSLTHIGPAPEVAVAPHMHLALLGNNPDLFTHWFGSLHFLFASGSASWQNLPDAHVGPFKPHLQLGVFRSTPFVFWHTAKLPGWTTCGAHCPVATSQSMFLAHFCLLSADTAAPPHKQALLLKPELQGEGCGHRAGTVFINGVVSQ